MRKLILIFLMSFLSLTVSAYSLDHRLDQLKTKTTQVLSDVQGQARKGVAKAQYVLANMYEAGKGVPKDTKKGYNWMKSAAKKHYAQAQMALSQWYTEGKVVPQSDGAAAEWMQKAAAQGYAPAQVALASMYFKGKGMSPNLSQAWAWATTAIQLKQNLNEKELAQAKKLVQDAWEVMDPNQRAIAKQLSEKYIKEASVKNFKSLKE